MLKSPNSRINSVALGLVVAASAAARQLAEDRRIGQQAERSAHDFSAAQKIAIIRIKFSVIRGIPAEEPNK